MYINSIINRFGLFIFLISSAVVRWLYQLQRSADSMGKQKLAVGGFSGRGLNASTGGIAVYNVGLTNLLDLVSITAVSRLNIEQTIYVWLL